MFFRVCDCTAGLGFAGQNRPAKCACRAFASSTNHAAARRHEGVPPALLSRSPPPAAQGPRLRFARSWALRSRLGAGGARRLTPSHIAQQRFKNQKPFSKENQRAPGLTPHSPVGRTKVPTTSFEPNKRTTIRLVGLANREVHTKQRFKNQNLRLQKTRIPTAGSVFLKCPFNGKAGPVILDSRHDDSGAPRSIFTEKPRKPAFRPSCLSALQTQRAPKDTDTNAGKHGK